MSVIGPRTQSGSRNASFWAAPAIDPPRYGTDPCDPVDHMQMAAAEDRRALCDFCVRGVIDDRYCPVCNGSGGYLP